MNVKGRDQSVLQRRLDVGMGTPFPIVWNTSAENTSIPIS